MLEARSSISDEIEDVRELLKKQVGRLDELATKKHLEPSERDGKPGLSDFVLKRTIDAFYGVEDENLENVDVMTDVSNPETMFTRYTVAPTASSNRSR